PTQRAETLLRIAEEIEARSTELSLTNTLENGSPVAETSGAAANAASIFRYFATLAPELEADDVRPFPSGTGESLVRKDPIGVCALIAPWNFPINRSEEHTSELQLRLDRVCRLLLETIIHA